MGAYICETDVHPFYIELFMHEIAITGIGIVSSLGTGRAKVKTSLQNGRSGIRFDPLRKELGSAARSRVI
jgi:3-oxoacyl-(acyl-carrier-protein) synthase